MCAVAYVLLLREARRWEGIEYTAAVQAKAAGAKGVTVPTPGAATTALRAWLWAEPRAAVTPQQRVLMTALGLRR